MPDPKEPLAAIRKTLPFLTVGVFLAAAYVGWTFYSRWNEEREAERARSEREVEHARDTLERLGGTGFKITAFYAYPGVVQRGEAATVCYGVTGASSVRIEPAVESLKPSLSRCLQFKPPKTATYTLTAEDGKGHSAQQSFVLTVK